jgi:hypothetical protein
MTGQVRQMPNLVSPAPGSPAMPVPDSTASNAHVLANNGKVNAFQLQSILGHKDARSTQVYVQGIAGNIKGLWD